MISEEKVLNRFVNEPAYRERVIANIRKEQDSQYEKRIKVLRSERDNLISQRTKEIERITKTRWESVVGGKLLVNVTEGKVKINQSEFVFSDIKGAELNVQYANRVVTEEKGTSKKHASLGGAVLGGLVSGAVGAAIGGVGLGKKKTKGTTTQTEIPMCAHVGVLVNLNGFISEIVLLTKQVTQSSAVCVKAQNDAQYIISKLTTIAKMPVPTVWLKVEDEPSVKVLDEYIVGKEKEIQVAIEDKPTYKIPQMYRTTAQKDMSDEEYLSYLVDRDAIRAEEFMKSVENKKAENVVRKKEIGIKILDITKAIPHIIGGVVGWAISIFALMFVLVAITQGGIASALMFMMSALSINPLVYKRLKSKMNFLRKWMFIILFVVVFIIGLLVLPTSATVAMA